MGQGEWGGARGKDTEWGAQSFLNSCMKFQPLAPRNTLPLATLCPPSRQEAVWHELLQSTGAVGVSAPRLRSPSAEPTQCQTFFKIPTFFRSQSSSLLLGFLSLQPILVSARPLFYLSSPLTSPISAQWVTCHKPTTYHWPVVYSTSFSWLPPWPPGWFSLFFSSYPFWNKRVCQKTKSIAPFNRFIHRVADWHISHYGIPEQPMRKGAGCQGRRSC